MKPLRPAPTSCGSRQASRRAEKKTLALGRTGIAQRGSRLTSTHTGYALGEELSVIPELPGYHCPARRLGNLAGGLSKTQGRTGNGLAADGSSVIPIGKPKGLERFPYRSFDLVAVQALVRRVAAP